MSCERVGVDLEDLSSVAEVAVLLVEEEEEDVAAVVELKHFWHMLLVAGFPVTPQLLTHRVRVSGTLNSVSSFSVL